MAPDAWKREGPLQGKVRSSRVPIFQGIFTKLLIAKCIQLLILIRPDYSMTAVETVFPDAGIRLRHVVNLQAVAFRIGGIGDCNPVPGQKICRVGHRSPCVEQAFPGGNVKKNGTSG